MNPMPSQQRAAFITARKGVCYLTVRNGRYQRHLMRIRAYEIDAQDKRDLRRRYPDIVFDWKKIARQLAEKREACRRYRSRRRTSAAPRRRQPLTAAYDPITRAVYVDAMPSPADAFALLDVLLTIDGGRTDAPSPPPSAPDTRRRTKPET
jgi:hypothetical protein